jgi:hypothetical protein
MTTQTASKQAKEPCFGSRIVGSMSRVLPLSLCLLATVTISACKSEPASEGASCMKKEDCADGLNCLDGTCTKLVADAPAANVYCETLTALAGSWKFDTTVVGAEDLSSRGINGHFLMTAKIEGCAGTIELTKTGHDDTVYSKAKIQHSEATLVESKKIPGAAEVTVSLKGKPTHELSFLVRDGNLLGYFRYVDSEWARAGMWGYVRGVRDGQELAAVEDFAVQPCAVQCLTQCDAARREADQTLDQAALAGCMQACGEGKPSPGCGPGSPLPEQLKVAVNGPAKSFEELCSKAGAELLAGLELNPSDVPPPLCKVDLDLGGKTVAHKLGKSRFNGSFLEAQLIEVGLLDAGYTGHLALALQTDAGWFWTAPLIDVSMSGVGGVSVGYESLSLRPRDVLSAPGREAVAEYSVRMTDSDLGVNEVSIDDTEQVAVCSVGSPPVCLRTTTRWSSERTLIDRKGDDPSKHPGLHSDKGELYIAFLPGDLVSISTPAETRADDRKLAGIYAWPK